MNKAFFIDKDGTLVDNSGYPFVIPSDKILTEQVLDGLKHIKMKGYLLIIVSNQSWIAKKKLREIEVEDIFKSVISKLKESDVIVDDYVYCPHDSSEGCVCRKPNPKMLLDMAEKCDINLQESYMVGDMDSDILAGKNAGAKTILVLTGNGRDFVEKVSADHVVENINALMDLI